MSNVRVREPHTLGTAEALRRIADFEEMLKKYGVKASWKGNHADVSGLGVKGTIDVSEQEARVELTLGFVAKAAGVDGAKLEGSIRKRLRAAFDRP
jgi:putative polyhydroxyalkanoate system protein